MKRLFYKGRRKVAAFVAGILFANTMLFAAQPAEAQEVNLALDVQAAILIDAESGQVLYELNADELRAPASMAKMMTEYMVLEGIQTGKIGWDSVVSITEKAGSIKGSGQLLAKGEKYTVRELFHNMSIYSGNDATVALAEFTAGSEENIVRQINEKIKQFGLSEGAYFANVTGLNNKTDLKEHAPDIPGETVLSARDTALIARRIINDHPEVLESSRTIRANLRDNDPKSPLMTNWNWMLEGWKGNSKNLDKYAYEGLDGLKTGHTSEAGYCFTGTAQRGDLRLISVVMGATSEPKRFEETRKLLDYGFNNFEKRIVVPAKSTVESLDTISVKKGVATEVSLVTKAGVDFVTLKDAKPEDFVIEAQPIDEKDRIAPIEKGQKLGTLTVQYANVKKSVDLITTDEVKKASWIRLMFRGIKNFFKDIFSGITGIFK